MYSKDDYLHNLNRPAMMAADDDDEDELFRDDDIDGSGPLNDDDLGPSSSSDMDNESVSSSRNSTGITRSALGFGLLAVTGIVPLALLILYMVNVGLSTTAMMFTVAFLLGMILSIWTFVYYRKSTPNFSKFEVHSFFSWPEIAVISVVLLGISFMNLSNLHSGNALRLSQSSTISSNVEQPEPVFAPQPPQAVNNNYEENEVLYQTSEFSPINGAKTPAKVNNPAPVRNKVRVVRPNTQQNTYRRVRPVAPVVSTPVQNTVKKVAPVATLAVPHEDEEGTSSTGKSLNQAVDEAVNMANTTAKEYTPAEPVQEPVTSVVKEEPKIEMEVPTSPFVSSVFLGGVLAAALGYALALALAGAILGLFRKFDNPFAAKTKELINEETGEITLETESQSMGQKIADYVFRFFIGFNMGGTVGFVLGLAITLPLYLLFWDKAQSEPVTASFLLALGVVKNPDLAYGTGLIIAGIMVPVIMLIVGKASPGGKTISEAEVRQVYSVPVTINKVSAVTAIPEPAIISFADMDESQESREGTLLDDFSDDPKESITNELVEEFGLDLEDTFGMKVNLPARTNGNGNGSVSSFEKQKVTSVLENSLGELGNVTVQVSAELGKATIMLTDWLNLSEGMLIELDKPVSEEIDILINDVCKGKGKLAVTDNHLSVRVSKSNFAQSKN
ncbi:FliM/FliN family flagellar motor switch protein [bacterium]|nr:MAG: FliM/FliN family flagellar motor switch protein [bacterium]